MNFPQLWKDVLHFFYPAYCLGCGDVIESEAPLCALCIASLPKTGYFSQPTNPIYEKCQWLMPVEKAASGFFYSKASLIQKLIFALKYQKNKDAGILLGHLLGVEMKATSFLADIDCIIPLPLHSKREKERGYNQSQIIANAIAEIVAIPVLSDNVERIKYTNTQTAKNRDDRFLTLENTFRVKSPFLLENKHVLLVDDVLTTGASLFACGSEILKINHCKLSVVTVACGTNI